MQVEVSGTCHCRTTADLCSTAVARIRARRGGPGHSAGSRAPGDSVMLVLQTVLSNLTDRSIGATRQHRGGHKLTT